MSTLDQRRDVIRDLKRHRRTVLVPLMSKHVVKGGPEWDAAVRAIRETSAAIKRIEALP